MVRQYLQHDKIAGEFANYLELYRKYESDYQIEEILGGTIREATLKKLSHASFDERLSVVNLLLSGCIERLPGNEVCRKHTKRGKFQGQRR